MTEAKPKYHTLYDVLYEMSRVGKSTETESSFSGDGEECEVTVSGCDGQFLYQLDWITEHPDTHTRALHTRNATYSLTDLRIPMSTPGRLRS